MSNTLHLSASSTDGLTRRALTEVSLTVAKSKRIIVVSGAGISCSCGIPDFRSSDGLYNLVKQQYPNVVLKGRDLFDASLFRDATSTAVFYTFISKLKSSIDEAIPSPTHHFLKTLDNKKKLLRSYTQNVDGLEARAGLLSTSSQEAQSTGKSKNKLKTKEVRSVQLHGDIHRVRCMSCSAEFPFSDEYLAMFNLGTSPDCPECLTRYEARVARSARPIRVGSLRPAIVLYDEPHPLGDDIGIIQSSDVSRKPDLLIIMGTSLKVHGLKKLVKEFARNIKSSRSSGPPSSSRNAPQVIFVNKTAPGPEWVELIDCHISGETDAWVGRVIDDWKAKRPADWEVQQTLCGGDRDVSMNGGFKTTKLTMNKDDMKKSDFENWTQAFDMEINVDRTALQDVVFSSSTSKRHQGSIHYNNPLEDSPTKKRSGISRKDRLQGDERKLLFTESTNNREQYPMADAQLKDTADGISDLSMQSAEEVVKPKTRANSLVNISGRRIVGLPVTKFEQSRKMPRLARGRRAAACGGT